MVFDGSGTIDPDGRIEDYIWRIDDAEIGRGPELEHTFDTPGEYTVTLTVVDDDGAAASASHQVVVHRLPVPPTDWEAVVNPEEPIPPLLGEIEPHDGAIIRGTEVWVRWDASDDETEGRVLWRKAGEAEVRVTSATGTGRLSAQLTGLETGATYEYVVEQFTGDFAQRSELRRFTVEGEVEFVPPVVEAAIERDHDQQVTLTLRNTTDEAVMVAAPAGRRCLRSARRTGDGAAGDRHRPRAARHGAREQGRDRLGDRRRLRGVGP